MDLSKLRKFRKNTSRPSHDIYQKGMAWEADDLALVTVCDKCHSVLHGDNEKDKIDIFTRIWFHIWLKEKFKNG